MSQKWEWSYSGFSFPRWIRDRIKISRSFSFYFPDIKKSSKNLRPMAIAAQSFEQTVETKMSPIKEIKEPNKNMLRSKKVQLILVWSSTVQ